APASRRTRRCRDPRPRRRPSRQRPRSARETVTYAGHMPDPDDVERVTELIGRVPRAESTVAVRDAAGEPVVIRNAPFLDDGTPLPTTYWLVDPALSRAIARLEAGGGVRAAQAAVDAGALA